MIWILFPEEEDGRREFRKMMERQSQTGGLIPEKDVAVAATWDINFDCARTVFSCECYSMLVVGLDWVLIRG